MCDINCDNLIDLSLDDEVSSKGTRNKTECCEKLSKSIPQFVPPFWGKHDSLDSDPFDCVQKLADRFKDPFDCLEKEACLNAKQAIKGNTEIKLGNLLSLSNDNLMDDEILHTSSDLGTVNMQELDFISPPVSFNEKYSPDSVSETDSQNSSSELLSSSKLKKNKDPRKRLLKLSISNATISSPTIRKQFKDVIESPISSVFCKAAAFGESSLSTESPLKLIEDEDITEKYESFLDLEKKFDADLEMLKIPILNELPSPVTKQTSINSIEHDVINTESLVPQNDLPNLETLKNKLNAKKSKISEKNKHEISALIQNLKTLISRDAIEYKSKKQANDLLESLTLALSTSNRDENIQNSDTLDVPPRSITRQGTFDLDLQEKNNLQEVPICLESSFSPPIKKDFSYPASTLLSPQTSPTPYCDVNTMQTDINNIVEQLGKLFMSSSADNQTGSNNPTFIVVMNTNQLNNSNIDNCKQDIKDAKLTDYLENSVNDSSPDLTKVNSLPRRRSQSLSTHDKKMVFLPLQYNALRYLQNQHDIQMHETQPLKTTPPLNGIDIPEFKTPTRLRRNSYSSGTPYTTQVGLRRTGLGTETKSFTHVHKSQTLDIHHERQQHAIVRPLCNNFPTFKTDHKKKVKPNTESIIKSTGPLKATIPIKKVAPMLKSSPPTPERFIKSKIINTPTTPIPTKGSSKLSIGVGCPNACSTPALFASPQNRTTTPMNKSKYSYMSATPNPKTSVINSSPRNLKRRTLTDFRSTSPLKPRVSNTGLQSVSSCRVPTGSSRLSVSTVAKTLKTPANAAAKTAPVKPKSVLTSRLSVGGSLLTNRNKENKRL